MADPMDESTMALTVLSDGDAGGPSGYKVCNIPTAP